MYLQDPGRLPGSGVGESLSSLKKDPEGVAQKNPETFSSSSSLDSTGESSIFSKDLLIAPFPPTKKTKKEKES